MQSRSKFGLLRLSPVKQLEESGALNFEKSGAVDKQSILQSQRLLRGYDLLDRIIGKSSSPEVSPSRSVLGYATTNPSPMMSPQQSPRRSARKFSNKELNEWLGLLRIGKDKPEVKQAPFTDIERVISLRQKTSSRKQRRRARFATSHRQSELPCLEMPPPPVLDLQKVSHFRSSLTYLKPVKGTTGAKEVVLVRNLPKLPFGKHSTYNSDDLGKCFERKVCRDWYSVNNSTRRSQEAEC
jgi:hypothetical protein